MVDLTRAKVVHAALLHCYNDRGCVSCPMYDECEGDCSILLREAAEVLAMMIHEKTVKKAKKECKYCKNGTIVIPFVFADDDTCEVHYADYCPVCGRHLT